MLTGVGTDQPSSGRWQATQGMAALPERIGSKNSILPSSTFSADIGLSAGIGGGPSGARLAGRSPSASAGAARSAMMATARAALNPVTSTPLVRLVAPVFDRRIVVVVGAPDVVVGVEDLAAQRVQKRDEVGLFTGY